MPTLLLGHRDVVRHLDALALLEELRAAYRADATGRAASPPQRLTGSVHAQGAASAQLPGLIPGVPAYTVRVGARFPFQTPPSTGLVHLHDLETGALLAVIDARQLTSIRSGVVGALATDALARTDAGRIAVIGAGALAGVALKSLRLVRSLTHVRVFDTRRDAAAQFAARMHTALSIPLRMADSVEEAVDDADVILTATWSREPFLFPEMIRAGVHVTALGADEPGKRELSSALLQQSHVVCDQRAAALTFGAVGNVGLGEAAIHAELGEVLTGARPGRTAADQVTIFAGVGQPLEDLAAAWQVYQGAREDQEIRQFDFGG